MADITMGLPAINRSSSTGSNKTIIVKDNPADASGTITTVEIWCLADITGCRVGTFYVVSGNTLKCRDSAVIGAVASGAKRTFTEDEGSNPLAIEVEAGDYIGCFYTDGNIEVDTSGYAGFWYIAYERIDPGDEGNYSSEADDGVSLYGIGEEPAVLTRSQAVIVG